MTTFSETKPAANELVSDSIRGKDVVYYHTERDVKRSAHIGKLLDRAAGTGSTPYYDSVVIVGAGFSATVMAARLARSEQFHGKVVMAGPRAEESRRLKDGSTLRGHGADYISYALGVPQYAFIDAVYGDIIDGRGVGTRQTLAMAKESPSGSFGFSRITPWQGGRTGSSRPIFYGARNSRMQGAMYDLMDRDGVIEVPELATSLEEARDLAPGKRPLIVNATHNTRLLGLEAPKVDWASIAVQAPLKVRPSGIRHIQSGTALLACTRHGGKMTVGAVTPFGDPLSPRSTYYLVMVSEVSQRAGFDKQQVIDTYTHELHGIADGLGMDADDPDETLYSGFIPGAPWKAPQSAPGTLELNMLSHQGVLATFADGMTAGSASAVAAAEAVIRGSDPDHAVRRATNEMIRDRRIWTFQRNKLARQVDFLFRTAGEVGAFYPYTAHTNSNWASAG